LVSQLCTATGSVVKINTGQTLGNEKCRGGVVGGGGKGFNFRVRSSVSLLTSCFQDHKKKVTKNQRSFHIFVLLFSIAVHSLPLSFVSRDSSVSIATVVLDG
jgi:hypothetical protein